MPHNRSVSAAVFVLCFFAFAVSDVNLPPEPNPSPVHRAVKAHDPGDPLLPFDIVVMTEHSIFMETENFKSTNAFEGVHNWIREFGSFGFEKNQSALVIRPCLKDTSPYVQQMIESLTFKDLNRTAAEVAANALLAPYSEPPASLEFAECLKKTLELFNETDRKFPAAFGFNEERKVILYLSSCQQVFGKSPEMVSKGIYFILVCVPGVSGKGTDRPEFQLDVNDLAHKPDLLVVYTDYTEFRAKMDSVLGRPIWLVDCNCNEYVYKCRRETDSELPDSLQCQIRKACHKIKTQATAHRLAHQCSSFSDHLFIDYAANRERVRECFQWCCQELLLQAACTISGPGVLQKLKSQYGNCSMTVVCNDVITERPVGRAALHTYSKISFCVAVIASFYAL